MTNSDKDVSIIRSIQTTLADLSLYGGRIDGLFGNNCRTAVMTMLNQAYATVNTTTLPSNTFDAPSVYIFIQTALARAGLYTITIDGKWGATSQASFDKLVSAYRQAIAVPNANGTQPAITQTYLTEAQFKSMLPAANWDKVDLFLGPLNIAMPIFDITTPLRKAHFMGQMLHETAYFLYSEEIASGSAYEGRTDLGNIYPGDGKLFKGRGPFQLTGRDNYVKCQAFLRKHLNMPELDITSSVAAASQVATNPLYGALTAGYFWGEIKPKLNATADNDDIYWVSVYVNGYAKQVHPYYPTRDKEPNHMKERVAMLAVTKKAFGLV